MSRQINYTFEFKFNVQMSQRNPTTPPCLKLLEGPAILGFLQHICYCAQLIFYWFVIHGIPYSILAFVDLLALPFMTNKLIHGLGGLVGLLN